jgi:hypothetical protein
MIATFARASGIPEGEIWSCLPSFNAFQATLSDPGTSYRYNLNQPTGFCRTAASLNTHVMKKMLTLLILSFNGFLAAGQCCPYIDDVTVDPANPSATDPISIYTVVTTPNIGSFIQHSHFVSGDTVYLEACYWEGMATALWTIYDTFNIGPLPAGDYTIVFTAQLSTEMDQCVVSDWETDTSAFTVTGVAGIDDPEAEVWQLYPNPVSSVLSIDGNPDRVGLTDITGKVVSVPLFTGAVTQLDLSDVPAGYYVVELVQDGLLTRKMIVKE